MESKPVSEAGGISDDLAAGRVSEVSAVGSGAVSGPEDIAGNAQAVAGLSGASVQSEFIEKTLKDEVEETAGSYAALIFAVVIGFSGTVFLSLFINWYEGRINPSSYAPLVALAVPPAVFFLLFIVVLLINPLVTNYFPALQLRKRELLVILALWLMTSVVCYVGMVSPMTTLIGTARNQDIARPTAQRVNFDQYLKPELFLTPEQSNQYHYGIGDGMSRVRLSDIPWSHWFGPMKFWLPYMLLTLVLSASLIRIFHRQWSKHELLTYPLADYTNSMIEYRSGRRLPAVFYERGFLFGVLIVCFIYTINGLQRYFPLMISIPLDYRHTNIIRSFPFIQKYCGREGYSLFRGMVYPLVVSIAVLLPTEISFSFWAGWVVMVLGTGVYFLGTGEVIGSTETAFISSGMYVAMFLAIIFIGRKEYYAILKHTFTFKKSDDFVLNAAVKACRVYIVCGLLMVWFMCHAGLDILASAAYVASFSLVLILLARFTAETGFPWLNNLGGIAAYLPTTILGAAALGPRSIAVMSTIGSVLLVSFGATNTIPAQETTVGKVAEKTFTPDFRKWFNIIILAGFFIAFIFSVVGTLSNNYSFGSKTTSAVQIDGASKTIARLQVEGLAETSAAYTLGEKVDNIQAAPGFWRFFSYGIVIIAFLMFMRLRFTWWPFHPLPFLMLNSWSLSRLYISFLVGWLIKIAILKVGGGKVFTGCKPFFIGVIAGQCLISGLWVIVNVLYYLYTDLPPPNIVIFP